MLWQLTKIYFGMLLNRLVFSKVNFQCSKIIKEAAVAQVKQTALHTAAVIFTVVNVSRGIAGELRVVYGQPLACSVFYPLVAEKYFPGNVALIRFKVFRERI